MMITLMKRLNKKGQRSGTTLDSKIINNDETKTRSINIYVEEKPTGEISAGAGVGTDGWMVMVDGD